MYKIIKIKNNEIKIKDLETKEILTLSTADQISKFIQQNKDEIPNSFLLYMLKHVKKDYSYYSVFINQVIAIIPDRFSFPKKEVYKFLDNNFDIFDDLWKNNSLLYAMSDKLLIKLYNKHKESSNLQSLSAIVHCIQENDQIKLDFVNKYKDSLEPEKIVYIIKRIKSDETKLDFVNQNIDSIDLEHLTDIINHIHNDNAKLDFLNQHKDSLDIQNQVKIVDSLQNDELKLDFLDQNIDSLNKNQITQILESIRSDELMLDILIQNKYSLSKATQVDIIMTAQKDETKLAFLDANKNIDDLLKIDILEHLEPETFVELYQTKKYNIQNLVPMEEATLLGFFQIKDFLNYLDKNFQEFPANRLHNMQYTYMIHSLKMSSILQVLEKHQNELETNQLFFLICNSSTQKQEKLFNLHKNKFSDIQKFVILTSLKESKLFKAKYDDAINELQISKDVKHIYENIFKNLGAVVFSFESTSNLLTEQCLTCLDEETIYKLIKYFAYSNKMPDISKVVENPELFKNFQAFREKNLPQNNLDVINTHNALLEFNKYYSLIEDCLKGDLTEQEKTTLITVLNDENVEVTSKEDLQNYATKRSEYIENLAEIDIDFAIIYTLTGMSWDEYRKKEHSYISDEQLSITSNDFSEELHDRIQLMQITKEMISMILNETDEVKNNILQTLKNALELEFSPSGSPIAEFRNAFPEFESELRSLYGEELHESLLSSDLPAPQKQDDVDVITLNGEDFKMLVHGLNAYGNGSSKFETREIGRSYLCTSLISGTNLHRANAEIYYGFRNIPSDSLALEGPSDIYSTAEDNSLDISSNRTAKFLKSDILLQESRKRYNEVVLYRDQIQPDCIVAFGEITDRDRQEAKRLNIPIVLINESIYQSQIEQAKEQENTNPVQEQETKQVEQHSPQNSKLRDIMLKLIEMAKNRCSAIQQEAIMYEIRKEYELLLTKGDAINV